MTTFYKNLSDQRDELPDPLLPNFKMISYPIPQPLLAGDMSLFAASSHGSYTEALTMQSPVSSNYHVSIPSLTDIPPTSGSLSLPPTIGHLNNGTGDVDDNSGYLHPKLVQQTQLSIVDDGQNFQFQRSCVTLCKKIPPADERFQIGELQSTYYGDGHAVVKSEASSNPPCLISNKEIYTDLPESLGPINSMFHPNYLKASQELLNEVVAIQKVLKYCMLDRHQKVPGYSQDSPGPRQSGVINGPFVGSEQAATYLCAELSPAEQHKLQNKMAKLLSMLDEVDSRYKEYCQHIQTTVSSFDIVAGPGAAKSYTELARQMISRHFRCLRDAIISQVRVIRRSLGEQDAVAGGQGVSSRLCYVDQHLRRQKALQHLGLMRNAWRPQRGLPESSVSVLRTWLFEHFLHPYPKDSEKMMLARQTGLTRGQVANWFINARVRLWKPMIEEMYIQEFGNSEMNSESLPSDAFKATIENSLASEDGSNDLMRNITSLAFDCSQPAAVNEPKPYEDIIRPNSGMDVQKSTDKGEMIYGIKPMCSDQRLNSVEKGIYMNGIFSQTQNDNMGILAATTTYHHHHLSELDGHGNQLSLALGFAGLLTKFFRLPCTHFVGMVCVSGPVDNYRHDQVTMVSHDSPPNPSANTLHQFIISDSIPNQNHFDNQQFGVYGSDLRGNNPYSPSFCAFPSMHSLGDQIPRSINLGQTHGASEDSEITHNRRLMDLLGAESNSSNHAQRLSLSLGSRVLVPPIHYRQRSGNSEYMTPSYLVSEEEARESCPAGGEHPMDDYPYGDRAFASPSTSLNRFCSTSYGGQSIVSTVRNSRYLKAAQSLLEEVVNVGGKAVNLSNEKYVARLSRSSKRGALGLSSDLKSEFCNGGILSPEKHELQVKIAKLLGLLEEVESRYEDYYQQLQDVVSSFEAIAGLGVAKSYTALALQAMSRHFCNLRDAIVSQINVTRRRVSQDLPKINMGLSQLSLIDQESRHNRIPLQQLGLLQSQRQAWRPIRGLPETSVAILRSWLFEHFLHPYPNDSEKLMLASQTGLTKNQVSNWFINARVRLWKPMIEEMYREEFADSSMDSNSLSATSSLGRDVTDNADD
ncbi:Homeobox KN domain [Dillenia turbinata]|uniref:Homeobox KN domain n=1 Tax=Dillenia turbinata TaxID=194707 RepID=A0AAN8ZM96_9MAGN